MLNISNPPRHRYTLLASALLLAGVTVIGTLALTQSNNSTAQSTNSSAQLISPSATPLVRTLPDFTDLVEQVGPSVVNIRTTEKVKVAGAIDPNGDSPFGGIDPNMLEFFKRFGMPTPNNPKGAPKNAPPHSPDIDRPRGTGSGFILSPDGLVMTNAHVIKGASEVLVTLTDKREFKAKILGVDEKTDVALLKIQATNLPAVKIGDVARLKVGEWVMAIGSPFGLENSVTAGIVSAKARDTGEYLPFIQTDVAINPGNSGGPLINMSGQVVGINSQIVTRSGGYNGVSLAIPIDEAMHIADQLRSGGRVTRGRIGVEVGPVSTDLAQSLGLTKAQGALVGRVMEDTPAAKAGLEAGDIIRKFDGKLIEKSTDLPRMVGAIKPSTKTSIEIFRRGKTLTLAITVAELESDEAAANKANKPEKTETPAPTAYPNAYKLGLTLTDLTSEQKKANQVKSGAFVDAAISAAASAGMQAGDVIVAVANVSVTSAKDADMQFAKQDKTKPIAVQIKRGERGGYIVIKPESGASK